MSKTQWYIGAPNGVILCVDAMGSGGPAGRLFHSYQTDGIPFDGADQMVFHMEELFNALNFPHPGTNERSFTSAKKAEAHYTERDRIMKDEALLSKHGDLGTFIVRVQHRQNETLVPLSFASSIGRTAVGRDGSHGWSRIRPFLSVRCGRWSSSLKARWIPSALNKTLRRLPAGKRRNAESTEVRR